MGPRKSVIVVESPSHSGSIAGGAQTVIVAEPDESGPTTPTDVRPLRLVADSGDRRTTYHFDSQARLMSVAVTN